MSAPVARVLIVGAGPAGLSLALALERSGLRPDVVELATRERAPGAALTLLAPALRALNALGLADRAVQVGFPRGRQVIGDHRGAVRNVVEIEPLAGTNYPGAIGITRPALHDLLTEASREAGLPVRLGVSVSAVIQRADAVEVRFTDDSTGTYDLVVGADGIHSRLRELTFPDAPAPHFTGQAVWRALVDRPAELVEGGMFYGPRNKAGINIVSDREMYLFLVQNVDHARRPGRDRMPELLREQLSEFEGWVAWVRDRLGDPERVDYRPLEVLMLPPPWHRGRIALIGDAVHATTPHLAAGAMCALEDGVVLAELLSESAELETALQAFARRRYERCRLVVENAVQLGEWEKHQSDPDADPVGLTASTWAALAQPA
jgi:naringenin degradation protein FdeE